MSEQILILFQIILIDLVLAADNAIIIGMLASNFKKSLRNRIMFWGISLAVIFENYFCSPNSFFTTNHWAKISWWINFIMGCL